jgi:hypothetical protein
VGRRLGLSVERIRQIRNRALDRLRERLTSPTGELREEEEGAPISKKLNRQNVIDMLTNVSPSVLMSHEADVLRMIFGINGRVPLTIQEISEATKWSEWQIERIRDAALELSKFKQPRVVYIMCPEVRTKDATNDIYNQKVKTKTHQKAGQLPVKNQHKNMPRPTVNEAYQQQKYTLATPDFAFCRR